MSNETPSQFLMDYKPWSYSKLQVASHCPTQFHRKYVIKEKVAYKESPEATVGKAVHKMLELLLREYQWDLAYEKVKVEHHLTSEEMDKVRDFEPDVRNFLNGLKVHNEKKNIKIQKVELQYAMNADLTPARSFFDNNSFFRGVIDLALFPEDAPMVIVLDHKTGKRKDISSFQEQLESYMILLKAHHPYIQHAKIGIHFLQTKEIDFMPWKSIGNIQPYWNSLIRYMNHVTRDAHQFTVQTTGWFCDYCEYQTTCEKGYDRGKETTTTVATEAERAIE
jgi:CRISPR/Cas system-associated exonuclease Cas4 (RecB family)